MRVVTLGILTALAFTDVVASAQSTLASRVEGVRGATAAGDHETAIARADSLVAWAPGHPNAVLTRAIAMAAAGRDAEAAQSVHRLLRWDARYAQRALQDSALARIRAAFADAGIDTLAERANRPLARGHVWATLEERDLVPEGTAWDPATRSLLVGSLNKNKVVAIAPDGSVRDRVASRTQGLGSVVGIHVDSARGLLWVASTARFDDPADTTQPAIFAFDAATGTFRRKVPAPPGPSFLNDLTTGRDGTVYVSDSRGGRILVLRPDAHEFETLALPEPLTAPNGITISHDGRHLFFSDLDHVRVMFLADGRTWRLEVPDSINMAGIDGLAFTANALITHHPLAFWRIARHELDATFQRVVGTEYFERNSPDSRTSTTGEVGDAYYYYIGNGQIDRMNERTIDSATMEPIRMYRIGLHTEADAIVAVALSSADSVAFLDAHTLERLATLGVGTNPHEIVAAADGRLFYVANARGGSITAIATMPRPQIVNTWRLPDGISAHDVAIGHDGMIWAAAGEPPTLFGIDATSGVVRHRHSLDRPGSWMLDTRGPDGAIVIASLEGGAVTLVSPESGRQTVFQGQSGEIDAIATPDGREIWSVNAETGDLTVFDSGSGEVSSREHSGQQPSRIVFTPDGRHALVVHGGDANVVKYDVATRMRLESLAVAAGPKVIALSTDGRRAYITHPAGALTMIDVASMSVLRSMPLTGTPDGVAVSEH
jgi:DNA-binding beta-propeller fold protein YncE